VLSSRPCCHPELDFVLLRSADECLGQAEGAGPDSSVAAAVGQQGISLFRRGHIFTDRDRVDDVPGQASASAAIILPSRKNRDAVPSPAAAGLPRTADTLPLASGPPPAVAIASIQLRTEAMRRDGRSRTGWVVQEDGVPW
jgi:hypothetical protein